MSNTNEFKKILSAVGAVSLAGAGIASLFTAGLAPLAWGSAAFILAGASGSSLLALDKIGLSEDEKEQALAELEELRSQLKTAVAERNDYKHKLETEVAEFKAECLRLKTCVEYWEEMKDPRLLEAEPVKALVTTLRTKLSETSDKLQAALAEIAQLKEENKLLRQRIAELENANDELDGELAARLLELAQLKTNFDYKLRDELHKELQPYCNKAVSVALEKKLAEIDKLRQAIAIQQEDLANYQQLMESLEKGTLPDIEKTYNSEMSARDSKLMELAGQNELLQRKIADLETPRQFPGLTYADSAGNRIIGHFANYGVLFDAHDTSVIPGGFCLRFRVDRNQDKTKLSGEEFDKLTNQCGLMGISTQPIHFEMDAQNFLISVKVFSGFNSVTGTSGANPPDMRIKSLSTVGNLLTDNLASVKEGKKPSQQGNGGSYVRIPEQDIHRQKFVNLGCFPADQFGEVVRQKFVTRVRVCAGSTGGKSPILEMVAIELAKANNGVIWLLNPIPGSEKDWFKIPGIIQPGMDANAKIVDVFEEFHAEFQARRNNLPSVKGKDFLLLAVDEDNATAREYEEIGTFIKDMYQLSDHVNMGFVSAGQGNNVSGLSGGGGKKGKGEEENNKKRTGNATKLMKEDFQNAVRIYTSEQAYAYLQATPFKNRAELLDKLTQLNELCEELNREEGLMSRPAVGQAKKVSPEAYRVAFVVSPACEPFFMQLPAYSSFSLEGLRFPAEARVTSPHWQGIATQNELGKSQCCPHCNSTIVFLKKPYANGDLRYECGGKLGCRKTFRVSPANVD
jgi:hypothetical protein